MVELNLRELSAPIEALRPEVSEAYKRLDAKWAQIAECLNELPIPCPISYTYDECDWDPENFACLSWKKWNGKRRVCKEVHFFDPNRPHSNYEITTTPYDEWSGEQRAELLKHVPGLFKAAEAQIKKFIEQTK